MSQEQSYEYRRWLHKTNLKDLRNEFRALTIPNIFADMGCGSSNDKYPLKVELVSPEYISPYKIMNIQKNPVFQKTVQKRFQEELRKNCLDGTIRIDIIYYSENFRGRVIFRATLKDMNNEYKTEVKIRGQNTIVIGLGSKKMIDITHIGRFLSSIYALVFIYLTTLQEHYPPEKNLPFTSKFSE